MNTIEQAREVAKTLRLQAMEIAALGNAGWGNTMIDASNTIDALLVELERIKGQEPVGRIASNGYPELYKPHSLPAWTLLYLAAGAQPAPKQEPDTSLIVDIEFDDGEKKAVPVSGTAQNMRYLKVRLDCRRMMVISSPRP